MEEKELITASLLESARVKEQIVASLVPLIAEVADILARVLQNQGKILLMGNGGSAADAQHIAAELVGRFDKMERRGLPAIALTTDTSILTSVGNDYGFEMVFTRQVEALAKPNDVVVGISTSGNSANVIKAIEKAHIIGAKTVGLTGQGGGKISQIADWTIKVPSNSTARIQESHITIGHIFCRLIEKKLFRGKAK